MIELAIGYLAIGACIGAWASFRVSPGDAAALALMWPIYGPILLERGPRSRRRATVEDRVEEARLALAAAVADADRLRRADALRGQIDTLQAQLDALADPPAAPSADRGEQIGRRGRWP